MLPSSFCQRSSAVVDNHQQIGRRSTFWEGALSGCFPSGLCIRLRLCLLQWLITIRRLAAAHFEKGTQFINHITVFLPKRKANPSLPSPEVRMSWPFSWIYIFCLPDRLEILGGVVRYNGNPVAVCSLPAPRRGQGVTRLLSTNISIILTSIIISSSSTFLNIMISVIFV